MHLAAGVYFLTPTQETPLGKVLLGRDSALGMKISDLQPRDTQTKWAARYKRVRRGRVLPPNVIPQLNGNVLGSNTTENSRYETHTTTPPPQKKNTEENHCEHT